jgi:fission process protein 1
MQNRALPAFTIHTAVKQAKRAFQHASNPRVKSWGPTVTGLAIVPVLPYLFDHPVEKATDVAFEVCCALPLTGAGKVYDSNTSCSG